MADHKSPSKTAPPQQLAEAQKYLILAFLARVFLPSGVALLAQLAGFSIVSMAYNVLPIVVFATNAALCIALYVAARRLGFGAVLVAILAFLSFVVPILGLVLVVSASIRLTLALRAHGWKVGLMGAQPAK